MNVEDTLQRAIRELRDGADGSYAGAAATRKRILAQAEELRRRRQRGTLVVLPLVAALIASTAAWGAATGRLPRWLNAATGRPVPQAAVVPPRTPSPSARTMPSGASARAPAPPLSEPAVPSVLVGSTEATPGPTPAAQPPATSPLSPRLASHPLSPSSREQAMYALAHGAHFVERNPAAALAAWQDYLSSYPDGRFAIEARYNRAISLVRLGRHVDARAALLPFAAGDYGGYRQQEARELLDAMAAGDAGRLGP